MTKFQLLHNISHRFAVVEFADELTVFSSLIVTSERHGSLSLIGQCLCSRVILQGNDPAFYTVAMEMDVNTASSFIEKITFVEY